MGDNINEEEMGKFITTILLFGTKLIAAGETVIGDVLYSLGWDLIGYPETGA